jgi:hemolysin activation/secretion protein
MRSPMRIREFRVHAAAMLAVTLCSLGMLTPAAAQTSGEAGRVERRFERPPAPTVEELLPPAERGLPIEEPVDEGPTLLLKKLTIEGSTLIDPQVFKPLYEDLLNTQVSLSRLQTVARLITNYYRNQGYILSRAVIPQQGIAEGHVRIMVVEGYIGQVVTDGFGKQVPELLDRMTDKLMQDRPLGTDTLERYTMLINDLPGASASATFSPLSGHPGGSLMSLNNVQKRYDLTFSMDNRGTEFNGPLQFRLTAGLNSLIQPFDRSTVTLLTTDETDELQLISLSHDLPLGSEGTRLLISGMYSEQEPGFILANAQTESESYRVGGMISHPFVRSRRFNVRGRVAFSAYHLKTKQLGAVTSLEDLRSLRFGVTVDWLDEWRGVNVADMELSQGLDILNALGTGSRNLSRADGHSDYTKITAYFAREQYLAGKWSAMLEVTGQHAMSALLASEEFGYGGLPFGRAHDSSEITGENGVAASAELRYTDVGPQPYLQKWQAYTYLQGGRIWRRGKTGRDDQADASDFGVGGRLTFCDYARAGVEFAKPLSQPVASEGANGHDWRVFFYLTLTF